MIPGEELLFLALGGSGEIGMNVSLYGCRGKWLMIDCGVTFADAAYPGIDVILPDLAFIEERLDDLVGVVLTHGHEDHIGALPYLAEDLGVPLYATPFTAELIRLKLEEEGIADKVELNIIEKDGSFSLGPFGFTYVPLAHSIPEGNALLIEQGALYPGLFRLVRQGLLKANWGTSENNRRAKFYELTVAGRKRLREETDNWNRLANAIGAALGAQPEEV